MKRKLMVLPIIMILVFALFPSSVYAKEARENNQYGNSKIHMENEPVDTSKQITVNGNTEAEQGKSYLTIQDAIQYISEQEDKTGWTIAVEPGEYSRFTVLDGLDDLTVKAASSGVVIQTMDGSTAPVPTSGGYPDTGGISIRNAQNVTLDNLTVRMGATKNAWYDAGISNYSQSAFKGNNFTVKNCTVTGSGDGYAVFVNSGTSKFTVQDSSFENVNECIGIFGDGTLVEKITVSGNTFSNASMAIHGYYGGSGDAGTLTFTDNKVNGTEERRCKVVLMDETDTDALKVNIYDNTLTYGIIGVVNLKDDGGIVSDVLQKNTFHEGSFYVDAVEPGDLSVTYASYQAPTESNGYWSTTNLESLDDPNNPTGAKEAVLAAIHEANLQGSKILNVTGLDSDGDGSEDALIKTFTWFKDAIYWNSIEEICIPVSKEWDDQENKDGLRPGQVTIQLLKDGEKTDTTLVLNEENHWAGSFKSLPTQKYLSMGEDGTVNLEDIAYGIEEVSVASYTSKTTGSAREGYKVTNVHEPATPVPSQTPVSTPQTKRIPIVNTGVK